MDLFNMFSGNTKRNEKSNFPWISLNDIDQLDEIQLNKVDVILIFKHSTRCGISRGVLNRFEKKYQDKTEGYLFYYLDLINFRALSAEIAKRFKVIHQSPQLIVIEEGKVKEHASHYEILEVELDSL